ncbi:MAG TPA: HD domain-containing phosphohydrolase [Treponemataceae bacterium]|nr:HD domain-containing phosphohydrolase [Treponemataceae bacterium]
MARIASAVSHTLYTEFLFQETVAETTRAFVSLMSEKDNETSQHLVRMARYSFIVARKYNQTVRRLEPALLREILWFAPLHDIGKIGITDLILHKTGPLTDDERKTMQTHVFIGERVLREMDASLKQVLSESLLKTAIEIIGGHHEKFDGSGYPRGLAGETIPLAGRIVAAADVFDALTSKRPYKDAWPVEKAVSWMKNSMPGHFDPEVFGCLESSIEDIMMVYEELKEV